MTVIDYAAWIDQTQLSANYLRPPGVRNGGKPMRRISSLFVLTAALAAVLAGCGGSSKSSSSAPASTPSPASSSTTSSSSAVTVSSANVSGLGEILVNSQGHTLYIFEPDKHARVTCVSTCAQLWPPLKLTTGQKATASGGVNSALLSSLPNPEGGSVATYAGWPLYTYVSDSAAGQATGQGIETNGGLWYVIGPAGNVIKKTP
jgi:predicted lipoprotein with Yx(FWY)xxD motif